MRRRLAAGLTATAVLGALLAASAASSASTSPPRPSTLDVAIPGPFGGCDPGSPSTTPATDAVLALVLPSAFAPGPLEVPVGDTSVIAEAEVVATQPQTVVYTIAPGLTWPSGRPFVTGDLVRTWRERRGDRVLADLGYRDVTSVVPDPASDTVTVSFRAPYSDWASLFDLIVPGPTATARCTLPTASLDPSIGPYAIVAASTTRITLEANPLWPDPPTFPRVVVTTDPEDAVDPSGTPRLAYLPTPTLAEVQAVTATGSYASTVVHTSTVVALDFAVHGRSSLSLRARRGVADLVDRSRIVDEFATPIDDTAAPATSELFGQGEPEYLGATGSGVLSPSTAASATTPGGTGADGYGDLAEIAAGDAWLQAAGYAKSAASWLSPARTAFSLCLAVPSRASSLVAVAHEIATQLGAQRIAVALRLVPSQDAVLQVLQSGQCASGIVERTGDGYATSEAAVWLRPSPPVPVGLSWTGVADPVVATSVTAATAVLDPVTAATTWATTDNRLWTLMVGLPLYSPSAYLGWSPNVSGLSPCDSTSGCVGEIPSLLLSAAKP